MNSPSKLLLTALAGAGLAGSADAAEILVTSNIATSTTWTKNNTYNLQNQIYVLPGATLTIEAGTVIASDVTANGSGALAVTAGAQIFILGTAAEPVIMTSKADVATWTGGNPKTGTYRQAANEWGNLTVMGEAYVSENAVVANTPAPNANNFGFMEGLTPQFPGDPKVEYGGGDDFDDSGTISHVSIRYAGRVVGLANELNGLSLGGLGQGTDIHHVEIMNNVDDGIEIWGGTVNLEHFVVWNVGDDSFDVDQGWRGKAQYGFIVQGYSVGAAQGSGIGDNALEFDGAEQSHYQPVTTTALYNLTVVGQPFSGDHGVAYRDGARVQVRNSVFMDLGERLVQNDNVDGDGGQGYGFGSTLTWAQTWATAYDAVPAHANDAPVGLSGWAGYPAQVDGFLNEMSDNVFFNNTFATAYNEATTVGVFAAGNDNVLASSSPIKALTRGPSVNPFGSLVMAPVTFIDPRAAGDAVSSVGSAPNDGFFTPAAHRGAFDATTNWARSWTAVDAYGFFGPAANVAIRGSAFGNVPNSIGAIGAPTLGNGSFAVTVHAPLGSCIVAPSVAFLVLDFGGPFSLPLPGTGCSAGIGELLLLPTANFSLLTPQLWVGAPVVYPFPVPNDPALLGITANTQAGFFDVPTGATPLGWALDFTVGL